MRLIGSAAHAWFRINGVLRVTLQTRWSAEDWPQVKVEAAKALALRSRISRGDQMLTELLAFLDELLSYLESARDVSGEGRQARDKITGP